MNDFLGSLASKSGSIFGSILGFSFLGNRIDPILKIEGHFLLSLLTLNPSKHPIEKSFMFLIPMTLSPYKLVGVDHWITRGHQPTRPIKRVIRK